MIKFVEKEEKIEEARETYKSWESLLATRGKTLELVKIKYAIIESTFDNVMSIISKPKLRDEYKFFKLIKGKEDFIHCDKEAITDLRYDSSLDELVVKTKGCWIRIRFGV